MCILHDLKLKPGVYVAKKNSFGGTSISNIIFMA